MKYRRIEANDFDAIQALCEKHKLSYDGRKPFIGFVAEGDNGELLGVSLTHVMMLLEPFIAEKPIVAVKLLCMTEGAMSVLKDSAVVAHVDTNNRVLVGELERLGFKKMDTCYALYKKV